MFDGIKLEKDIRQFFYLENKKDKIGVALLLGISFNSFKRVLNEKSYCSDRALTVRELIRICHYIGKDPKDYFN